MKLIKNKHILIIVGVIISIAAISGGSVMAANLSTKQKTKIIDNCASAKNTLNQLHAYDALLRVNMGQMYESLSTKFMKGFNGRLHNNNFNNNTFVAIYDNYDNQLDVFRTDYIKYEQQLSQSIAIDCRSNPEGFYNAVAMARIYRNRVHGDVNTLNDIIDQYKQAVSDFKKQYQSSNLGSG